MIFNVFTLFPETIYNMTGYSVIKRGIDSGLLTVNAINIRDFAGNKHGKVDDYPYGGGAGMVMAATPIINAINATNLQTKDIIFMSPKGKVFTQKKANELSLKKEINILCGHYEGIDQRVIDSVVTEEISIGDYVLTGGEIAAAVLIDSVGRLVSGVLGSDESVIDESHQNGFLEYPQYTRPADLNGMKVPEILLSGHHKKIEDWRKMQSIKETILKRPDLIRVDMLSDEDKKIVEEILDGPLTKL